jgi:glycosyltransferase involved in cell wall biosynthesis
LNHLVIASPSRWLAKCAGESALFRDLRIEVLPNGVDDDRFRPMDHAVVRRILELPQDRKLILFSAGSATSYKRKGYHLLVEALKKLETQVNPEDYALLVVGASSGASPFSIQTHFLGTLRDEISMALVYAAADVFVAPSIEENLANTVLESLSCGTPVVAFEVGGMPDMIVHQKNGYLASAFDTSDLAGALLWILKDKQRWKSLSAEARDRVVRSFSLQGAANRYLSLYEEMLGKWLANGALA